jgi:trimethylamine:corrinoid methyltransferase-like protein
MFSHRYPKNTFANFIPSVMIRLSYFYSHRKELFMRISEFSLEQIKLVQKKIEQTLWEIGLRVEMKQVRDLCASAGAEVRGDRVHFPPHILNHLLSLAPSSYEIRSPFGRS